MKEEYLLTGAPEPPMSVRDCKILGIKLCESYRRQFGAISFR